jgi:porin
VTVTHPVHSDIDPHAGSQRTPHGWCRPVAISVFVGLIGLARPAVAQAPQPAPATPNFFSNLFDPSRTNLLGDLGGLRTTLANAGITFSIVDINEVLGNTSGGINRGFDYEGLTTVTIQLDTQKAFGWAGGTFNISGLNIRGRDLSTFNLLSIQTASGIEAQNTTRLWEIWYQQAFAGDVFDVKLGQQSIDQEFMTSQYAATFINTAMGWPMVPTEDLYAGGPAYPLSSLGIRLRGQPGGGFTVLGGVFQDNPPGGPFFNDSQLLGSTLWGGNFNLRTGALFIAEVQYALNPPPSGDATNAGPLPGLPGTYKLGVWYDTASFPSRQFDNAGVPLASPASNGIPQMLPNNFSIYALADQMVWRPDPKGSQSLGVFARLMGAPGDRNLLSFSVNAGVVLKAPLPTRDNDSVGLGFGLVKLSSSATGFDHDVAFFTGMPYPIQSTETFIELTYQIQVTPWLVLQPDFQYVWNPGGGIPNPNAPTLRVENEAVFGIRSTVTF